MKRVEEEAYKRGYRITRDGDLVKGDRVYHRKPGNRGYYGFLIYTYVDGRKIAHACMYHRLQAYQKYGDAIYDDGIIVRHLNDIKTDNSYNNIAIGTYKDNYSDRKPDNRFVPQKEGLDYLIKSGKYIPVEIRNAIRRDHESGIGYKRLQKKYGHSLSGLCYICTKSQS